MSQNLADYACVNKIGVDLNMEMPPFSFPSSAIGPRLLRAVGMASCDCFNPQLSPADDLLVKYQYISDVFIALAYFSIPLELLFFLKKTSAVAPYRWVLVQFSSFIFLCGATHLINLWTISANTRTAAIVMTVAKILTSLVSCATAVLLVHLIPSLLGSLAGSGESLLNNKADRQNKEAGLFRA
ncbi:hypothetical protein MLD38_031541 [Melastoma candidum]|uniref:Uncharacterized protein n=1 Tax=Melastoma candidum TaxID=119954 RepID=A0ACB9MPG6_9MYRT|nr:hypothetical protein MLD38_031541 [Melastoma candidum]